MWESTGRFVHGLTARSGMAADGTNGEQRGALIHQVKAHLPRVVMRFSYHKFLNQKQADPKNHFQLDRHAK
jgi:hypothetical protein